MQKIDDLRILYRDITGITAPASLRSEMLDKLIDWHLYCIKSGKEQKEAFFYRRGAMEKIDFSVKNAKGQEVLMREWNGKVHIVSRCNNGRFRYGNQTFASLTRVAKEITGGHRSGPAFFRKGWRGEL
jgi:hypothetical protein